MGTEMLNSEGGDRGCNEFNSPSLSFKKAVSMVILLSECGLSGFVKFSEMELLARENAEKLKRDS